MFAGRGRQWSSPHRETLLQKFQAPKGEGMARVCECVQDYRRKPTSLARVVRACVSVCVCVGGGARAYVRVRASTCVCAGVCFCDDYGELDSEIFRPLLCLIFIICVPTSNV